MKNVTLKQSRIAVVAMATFLFSMISVLVNAQAVYTTVFGDWTQTWNSNSGSYQGSGGPAIYSFGTDASNGQVMARLLTSNGTTGGAQQPLRVGQKLIIRLTAPVGGGRTGIQTGGRIGFSLRSTNDVFNGGNAFDRYNSNAMLRVEFQGGQSTAQLVHGAGTTLTGMPNFTDFTNGQTYEIEMISDKEFNMQIVSGTRYNIKLMTATGTVKQMTIANLGENRDGLYTNVEVANTSTVSLVANTAETLTVIGVISENGVTPNTVTKSGAGTVILTGQNTYTGLTTVSNGILRLNAAAANTINPVNNITLASAGTLQVSQDQTVNNLVVPAGANLIVDAGKTLTVTGSFTGGGTITNNGTIKLSGTSAQSFPGGGTIAAMNNLVINNNSASGVTLSSTTLAVTGTLSFLANTGLKSLLTTGVNIITANTISGASNVNGWVNGTLEKNITGAGVTVFEVGDAFNYAPASLNVSASGFTAGILRASTRTQITSALGFSSLSLLATDCINRVWSVTRPGGSFTGNYTGTFTYVAGDLLGSPVLPNLRTAIYNGSAWNYFVTLSAGPSQVMSAAGIVPTSTSDIVFAMPRPVTISGVLVTPKVYDAGTSATLDFSSAVINTVQPGNVVNITTAFAAGTYNDRHVGSGKPVTVTNAALGGADANAYVLTSQPAASGDITTRPLTVTAATNTKTYDGNISALAVPVVTPAGPTGLQGTDVANFTETYDTKNAGTGKVLTPAGTVSDGNSGNNYSYAFVTDNTGVISNIPITNLTATPGSIPCNGGTTTLTVSASGGDGALQYSLGGTASFPYQSSTVFNGVSAGTYTLTVKDEDNFTEQLAGIVVGQPGTLGASFVKTNVSQCVANNGAVSITATGGSGLYNYSWTGIVGSGNPATTPFPDPGNVSSISGLNIGFYNVTVTDQNGCGFVVLNNIHVEYAYAVNITNSGSFSSSCANTGSIILYGNAGVQPYTYSLDGTNYQAGNTFTSLAPGPYTAYVKDAAGCVSTKNITVTAAPVMNPSFYVRNASSCANDGSIELYRTGGIPPFTYSIDGINFQSSNKFLNVPAGSYTGYIRDAGNCEAVFEPVTVLQGAALTVTAGKTNSSTCVNDGTIQVNVSGGVAPYTYSKSGMGGPFQPGNSFSLLAPGNYPVVAMDSKGCTGSANVNIALNTINVTAYATAASSCAATNGKIQLFRTGGVGPYTYSIDGSTYQASTIFTGLAAGTYDGYVKDSKTCIGVKSGIVVGPACGPVATTRSTSATVEVSVNNVLAAEAYPNPSNTEFTMVLKTNSNEKVVVIVTDIMGRKVYQAEGVVSKIYKFGNSFTPGIYMLQVVQGKNLQTIRLIKE